MHRFSLEQGTRSGNAAIFRIEVTGKNTTSMGDGLILRVTWYTLQ